MFALSDKYFFSRRELLYKKCEKPPAGNLSRWYFQAKKICIKPFHYCRKITVEVLSHLTGLDLLFRWWFRLRQLSFRFY